jgi:hypothetical protein
MMIPIPSDAKTVFLYKRPINMGWGPTRLSKLCRDELNMNPKEGGVYMFFNKAQDRLKIFFCDQDGDQTLEKMLVKGSFLLPTSNDSLSYITIRVSSLPTLFKS